MSSSIQSILEGELQSILEGELPYQSAVYVVLARRERVIHVTSFDVNARYAVAKGQCENAREYHSNGEISDNVLSYLENKCIDLGVNNELDKCGFYNGLNSAMLGLWSMVCENEEERVPNAQLDALVPYTRYDMPYNVVRGCIGQSPVIEERMFGDLSYQAHEGGMSRVAVSVNHMASPTYVIFKIDQMALLCEKELAGGFIFTEEWLSSQLNIQDLQRVREKAVDLVRLLVTYDDHDTSETSYYEPVADSIKGVAIDAMCGRNVWPMRMHPHKIFE